MHIGIFPKTLKIAKVKPVFKSGDKSEMGNYRPISLLSSLSKIFEKVLKNRIVAYIDRYKLISDRQYGFQPGRSTQDAIAYLSAKINGALDSRTPALCIFVDLAKAFDTVNHSELLEVLEGIGFRGVAYDLCKSYLTDRVQCVEVGNKISATKSVNCGVPQGTVLGPLLFTLYVNDIFNINVSGDIISFADDTAIFYQSKDWDSLKTTAENDFGILVNFFNGRKLTINWEKTYYLPFTSYARHLPHYTSLEIRGFRWSKQITSVKVIKYLGVIIDRHLRWDEQINSVIKKLRCLIPKFKFFKQIFEEEQLKILYFSLVQSHLIYGIIAWGGATNNYLTKLERTQKWLIKIIYGKTYLYPTESLYRECGLFSVGQLFCRELALAQFKNRRFSISVDHGYATRNKEGRHAVPRIFKTIGQRCHTFLGPRFYNYLPIEVRTVNSFSLYKKKVVEFIRNLSRDVIGGFIDLKNS